MALPPHTRLGPYEILAPLGAGGMGEVYRARDTRLERTVAVKVLPPFLSSSPEARQRFEREAKAISKLSHPNICALHDVGREGDVEFLVMEYLEGETLAARLAKGPLPTGQTLRIGAETAGALEMAHRHGIVHRDLKPANVMLTKAGVKLLDFGLAKAGEPETSAVSMTSAPTVVQAVTQEGTILGTLSYMATEQLEGKKIDSRTDIFALGATLYEMATGRKAFSGDSQASVISSILTSNPPAISAISPMTPPALDRLVRTCLAKDPDDRWQSAGDVARELKWMGEAPAGVPAAAAHAVGPRWRERIAWLLAAGTLLAAALVLALRSRRPVAAAELTRFAIVPPAGQVFLGGITMSPDA